MARSLKILAVLISGVILSSCAKDNLVVVLPETNGHVGAVVVHADGDAILLDKAYAGAAAGKGSSAMRPVAVSDTDVSKIFGTALAAQPIPPKTYTLYFDFDSEILTPASKPVLEEVFAEIGRRKAAEIVVTGHTDTFGAGEYNDKLSLKRATSIRQLFIARGLAPEAVIAAGRGKRELLIPTPDQVHEARNRRVEITVR